MKKLLLIFLCVCLLLAVASCGGKTTESPENANSKSDTNGQTESGSVGADANSEAEPEGSSGEDETAASGNILVAYFSLAGEQYEVGVIEKGNTEIVAEMIADAAGADTFKIEATKEYPTTYDGLLDVSRQEENDPPEIAGAVDNMDDYDIIFLGYPIWWGDTPTIIKVFLQSYDLSGKTIVPFCTHGGSGLAGTAKTIGELCPDSSIGEGLAIRGSAAQNDREGTKENVTKWLEDNGII